MNPSGRPRITGLEAELTLSPEAGVPDMCVKFLVEAVGVFMIEARGLCIVAMIGLEGLEIIDVVWGVFF